MIEWTIRNQTGIISGPGFRRKCDVYVFQLERHGKTPEGVYGIDEKLCIHSRRDGVVHIWYAETKINGTQVKEFIKNVSHCY